MKSTIIPRLCLAVVILGHFVWLLQHFEPVYSSPDASGYFVQARLIATDGQTGFRPESPLQYMGVPWLETEDGDFFSRYPPGLPTLLAPVFGLLGPTAALLVIPLLASLSLLILYLLTRLLVDEPHALLAAILLAAVPVANRQALHADAHTAATFLLLLGLWLLLRWARAPSAGRAFIAAFVIGFLPAVRYPEAIAGAGVLLFLLANVPAGRARWTNLGAAVAGVVPTLLWLALHNQHAFGSPFQTGYGLTNEQTAFAWEPLRQHFIPYLEVLFLEGLGLFFPLGLLGMLFMLTSRTLRAFGLTLLLIVVPVTLLYMAYYWGTAGDPTLRFFQPTFPLYFLAGVWLWRTATRRIAATRTVYAVLLLIVLSHAFLGVRGSAVRMAREQMGTSRGAAVLAWLEQHAQPGAVVISNRAVLGSLEYLGRYRLVDDRLVPGGPRRAMVRTSNPNLRFLQSGTDGTRPSPHQHDKGARLREKYRDRNETEQAQLVVEDLLAWAGDDDIYWICMPEEIQRFTALTSRARFEQVEPIDLPTPGSALCSLFGDDPLARRLPYWVAQEPLVAYRLMR